jgi:hypothetical protein
MHAHIHADAALEERAKLPARTPRRPQTTVKMMKVNCVDFGQHCQQEPPPATLSVARASGGGGGACHSATRLMRAFFESGERYGDT